MDLKTIRENKNIKELLDFSVINLDKPSGPTSFQTDEFVKKWLNLKKTSHFGTLDPKVGGALPIALNRACKLSGYFMGHDKTYVGIMHCHKSAKLKILQEIIDKEFSGKIKQIPPKRSKVKRQEREREIKKFEVLEKNGKDFLFLAEVQAGTYIRKLIHDLGEKIGGAHMLELRRIKAGIFSEKAENFVNLYQLKEAVDNCMKGDERQLRKILIPGEIISEIMPIAQAKEEAVEKLLRGKPIFKEDLEEIPMSERFAVFLGDRFIEVAKKVDEGNIIAKPEFVYN